MNQVEITAPSIIEINAIGRPQYDNRRLGNLVDWIVDNFSTCMRYYNSLPDDGLTWDKACMQFMRCQYDSQVIGLQNERYTRS